MYMYDFGGMYVSIGQLMKKNENINIKMTGNDMVVWQKRNDKKKELFRGTLRGSIYITNLSIDLVMSRF